MQTERNETMKNKAYQKPVHKRWRCRVIEQTDKTLTVRHTEYNGFFYGATDVYTTVDKAER